MKIATPLSILVAAGALAVTLPAYAKDGDDAGSSSSNASASSGEHANGDTKAKVEDATPTATPTAGPGATPTPSATPTSSATPGPTATPVAGESVVSGKHTGTVRVREPNGEYAELAGGTTIPVGSILDTSAGTVVLKAALPGGGTNAGSFSGGRFEVRQDPKSGITDLYLRGGSFARCRNRSLASISSTRPKPIRSLWGSDDGGRFRTHGRNSVATVRGTRWLTEDRCEGTLTRVVRGAVEVRDARTHRRVTVKAGHSYLARPR